MKKSKKPMVIIGMVLVLCLIVAGICAMTANSTEGNWKIRWSWDKRYNFFMKGKRCETIKK